ncbi:unnamed protein product, partial [Didymodactylos carnosus]
DRAAAKQYQTELANKRQTVSSTFQTQTSPYFTLPPTKKTTTTATSIFQNRIPFENLTNIVPVLSSSTAQTPRIILIPPSSSSTSQQLSYSFILRSFNPPSIYL